MPEIFNFLLRQKLEKTIITLFTSKYIQKTYFGREYFEGDHRSMIGDLCDIVKNEVIVSPVIDEEIIQDVIDEEIIQDVIDEEIIQEIIVEETIQDIFVEETIQDVIVEETIQDVIVEENDTSNDMRAVLCTFVSNIIVEDDEEEDVDEEEKEKMLNCKTKHYCTPCGYPCNSRSNFTKHSKTAKHIERIKNPDAVVEGEYKCKNCVKTYKSHQGLWVHKKICKAPEVAPITTPDAAPDVDLHAKIDNLERIMMEMAKNLVS